MRRVSWIVAGMAFLTLVPWPARSEDDLAVVKQAMARAETRPSACLSAEADVPPSGGKAVLQWLKIRILDKGSTQARVSVNVPLGLVRALGADLAVDLSGQGHARTDERGQGHHAPTVGELLRLLESGQQIVEIESDDARIKVWVE